MSPELTQRRTALQRSIGKAVYRHTGCLRETRNISSKTFEVSAPLTPNPLSAAVTRSMSMS